jgi:hypothetical protein
LSPFHLTPDEVKTIQLYWLPKMHAFLDQLEIWFSLLTRKLLQPNNFCRCEELRQAILDFITRYNQTAKPLTWSYTVEQLQHKLATPLMALQERGCHQVQSTDLVFSV